MVSIDGFRKLALSFPYVNEQDHWGRPSFTVKGKIFSTLRIEQGLAIVKLSLIDQSVYVSFDSKVFYPVPGGWGRKGATFVELKKVKKSMLKEVLGNAWAKVAPKVLLKNPAQSVKKNPG